MTSGSLVAIAEVRVEDVAAWQAALRAEGTFDVPEAWRRLSLHEIWILLAAAYRAITNDLPAVLSPDPTFGPFSAPPAVELRLFAGQPAEQGFAPRDLTDLIDFSPVGTTDRQSLPLMTVTVSGPGPAQRRGPPQAHPRGDRLHGAGIRLHQPRCRPAAHVLASAFSRISAADQAGPSAATAGPGSRGGGISRRVP